MEGGKAISTPLPPYVKLSAKDSLKYDVEKAEMAKVPYASCMGSLMYAMIATRPDIAFAVGVVIRYILDPRKKPWEVVKSILWYLSGTRDALIKAIVVYFVTQNQILIIEGQLQDIFSHYMVVQYLGCLAYRNVWHYLPLR